MAPQDGPMHMIDRTPEYEDFMRRLRDFHIERGTALDSEPKVGSTHLDLFKVFNHVVAQGGYDKISEEKLAWRRIAHELGIHSHNEASTAFALKEKFYKNLAAFEIRTVHNQEPPPKDILEDVTAKGAGLLTRTRENFKGIRQSAVGASGPDSAASGDDGTPTRERPVIDAGGSARASRGLREAPAQRVIFQPDTGPSRTRAAAAQQVPNHTNSPNMSQHTPGIVGQHGQRGPSLFHRPATVENMASQVEVYQPRHIKALSLRPVHTPSSAPDNFLKTKRQQRQASQTNQGLMLPGTGFDGPNIYTRCLNALRSRVPAEQAFALNHLVKISFERGDKFRFDSFPGLAEGLVEKALHVGNLFYHIDWTVSWDSTEPTSDVGLLDGNSGTSDIIERIRDLIEKELPDVMQTERYSDELLLVTEAVLTLRNMLTLSENAHYMADFYPLKDLIIIIMHLPAKDSLIELKHMALDMAEQITPFLDVGSDDPLYRTLLWQLTSDDRGTILTALRALGRISVNLEATNKLGDVPSQTLERIVSWLLLNDDELTDACLDFLYQYTAVVPNVDKFIRSLSPHVLVDHLTRLLAHGAQKTTTEKVLAPERKIPSRDEIASIPEDLTQELLKIDEPERVHAWVRSFFEEDSQSSITQLSAWQAYQGAFVAPLKAIGQSLISPADFIRNSTSVYKDSNAQVHRDPADQQQRFIIQGLRARPAPLSVDGVEYKKCEWTLDPTRPLLKCGKFYLDAEQMWNHVMADHLRVQRNEQGQFDNVEREYMCTWGSCTRYRKPTKMHLQDLACHVNTHITSPPQEPTSRRWVIPAVTLAVSNEETQTQRDERNPNLPPQAAGIPLSAVLILRNLARNVVKTDAEEDLMKAQGSDGSERGGWNERLFRPVQPRLFEILAENRALAPYIASLLEYIRVEAAEDGSDSE
ncbi:uncharacterized protein J7T54_005096 [Emericellopsis cladophorae]|uniref:RSC complex subunit Rsc9 n=1 Tax=Emericellopsis cladophorae TaxID=2686198 RepID=A0A9P9Y1Q7_9HYPO|nr:uncharacterized protein J7T54_005096 [Emericellopsis cladophorae]KAI6781886.1 hypothetical protein J7T54_005096 [Emericellopsis cladophorae]